MAWNGVRGVLYREWTLFSRRAGRNVPASLVSPLLFLVAFGWGFGSGTVVEGVPYLFFLVPGLVAMSSLMQSYGIAQELNIARFYFRVFDEFLIAPVTAFEIVLGETLAGMFRGLLSAVLILLVARLFGVSPEPTPLLAAALVLHTFTFAALGVAMAMLVRDHAGQAALTNFVITPMIFLGGTFFPLEKLPAPLAFGVAVLPLSHSVRLIRDSFLGRVADLWHLPVLFGFAAFFFILALRAVKRVES
jgi:ABC-type multidrug transport system permease subunit